MDFVKRGNHLNPGCIHDRECAASKGIIPDTVEADSDSPVSSDKSHTSGCSESSMETHASGTGSHSIISESSTKSALSQAMDKLLNSIRKEVIIISQLTTEQSSLPHRKFLFGANQGR